MRYNWVQLSNALKLVLLSNVQRQGAAQQSVKVENAQEDNKTRYTPAVYESWICPVV